MECFKPPAVNIVTAAVTVLDSVAFGDHDKYHHKTVLCGICSLEVLAVVHSDSLTTRNSLPPGSLCLLRDHPRTGRL